MKWVEKLFELNRGGKQSNLRPMEGLRGFAVFLVFLVHFASVFRTWMPVPKAVSDHFEKGLGHGGVNLFFILSGYLIYRSLMERAPSFLPYFRRRIQRIYPVFLVMFTIYLLLSWIFPGESRIPDGATAATAYLVQNLLLLPGVFPIEPMITVAWSLSYEMFFYLFLPLFISLLRLRERPAALRIALITILTIGIILLCWMFKGPIRFSLFTTGMLLHEVLRGKTRALPGTITLLILAAGFLVVCFPPADIPKTLLRTSVFCVTFFLLCLSCFREPHQLPGRIFSWTPLRWLGNMSYSYYLMHGLALNAFDLILSKVLPPGYPGLAPFATLLAAAFLVTLVASAALFALVERPFSLNGVIPPQEPASVATRGAQEG